MKTRITSGLKTSSEEYELDDTNNSNHRLLTTEQKVNIDSFLKENYDWSIARILNTPELFSNEESLKQIIARRFNHKNEDFMKVIEAYAPLTFSNTKLLSEVIELNPEAIEKFPMKSFIDTETLKKVLIKNPRSLTRASNSFSITRANAAEIIDSCVEGIKLSPNFDWKGSELLFSSAMRISKKFNLNNQKEILKDFLELKSPLCQELSDFTIENTQEIKELVKQSLLRYNNPIFYANIPGELFNDDEFCDWLVEKGHPESFEHLPDLKRTKERSITAVKRFPKNIGHIQRKFVSFEMVDNIFKSGDFFTGSYNLGDLPVKDAENLLLKRLGKNGSSDIFISNHKLLENKEIAKKAIAVGVLSEKEPRTTKEVLAIPEGILTDEEIKDAYVKSVVNGTSAFIAPLFLKKNGGLVEAKFSLHQLTNMLFSGKIKSETYENIFNNIKEIFNPDYSVSKKDFFKITSLGITYFQKSPVDLLSIIDKSKADKYKEDFFADMKNNPDELLKIVFGPLFKIFFQNSNNTLLDHLQTTPDIETLGYQHKASTISDSTDSSLNPIAGSMIRLSILVFNHFKSTGFFNNEDYYEALVKFRSAFAKENKDVANKLLLKVTSFCTLSAGGKFIKGDRYELLRYAVINTNFMSSIEKKKMMDFLKNF